MPRAVYLPKQKAEVIHNAAIEVLENTGIFTNDEEAEQLLLDAGATRDDGRVLIPRKLIQESLEKVNKKIQLYDRDGKKSIALRNGNTYFGPGSDALYNVDRETRKIRESTIEDIRNNVTLVDSLSSFSFVMSTALPRDIPPRKLYSTVFSEMVKHTTKPIITTATSLDDITQIHEVASIVAGGEEALRQKPFFVAYLEPISPLYLDKTITNRLLYCAAKGIPISFAAGANCGGGAPITLEGGVVQGTAESFAGMILGLLKNENLRFVFGANTSALDMKTSIVSYGAPEWFKTVGMYADIGKLYDLPSWGTAGCSDSFCIDAQAAMEAYEGIMLALMSATTLAHDVGYLAYGVLYDSRMLVLADEMIKRARHVLKEIDLSRDSLAVEVIDEVSRKNELYLAHPHSHQFFRDSLWLPPEYINRKRIDAMSTIQLPDMLSERVELLLSGHTPTPLAAEKADQIDNYLASL